uniref:Cytosolic oligopeptidase A n=1 Tax=Hirondellea gigas TaxID=1518452 RepID=A0A2P2I0I2_9CRUS
MYKIFWRNCLGRFTSPILTRRRQMSYVVLLPEDPVDTAECNALLRCDGQTLPDFTQITGDQCFSGIGKLSLDFETKVWEIEEKVREEPENVNFSSVLNPLDSIDAQLNIGWSAAKILYIAQQDKLPQKTYLNLHERARRARMHKFQSKTIYNACKKISENEDGLDEAQERVLRKFLLESQLNGIELQDSKAQAFVNTLKKLDTRKQEFRNKVMVSGTRFAYTITDPNIVKDFPEDLLQRMSVNGEASSGPWKVSLKPNIYDGFMRHCSKRGLRWNTWQAYNIRGSKVLDPDLDNSVNIEEIRGLRAEQAKQLGYSTFAAMSMETKMASSVDNVLSMITSLMVQALPKQTEEMESLVKFSGERGFDGDALQAYDVPYYSRLQQEHCYSVPENVREFLPLDHVLGVLLRLCSQLFAVEFEEVDASTLNTWHQDVRFFNIIDQGGSIVASFYLDPYARPGQKLDPSGGSGWCVSHRNRSSICSVPVAALIFNFPGPSLSINTSSNEQQSSLLSLAHVSTLFAKFGEALQHLLTTVPHSEASGQTNIEWDAVPMLQHFMTNWLQVPEVLSELCQHHRTQEQLSTEAISNIILASNHMAGHALSKELYLANLDLLLHTTGDFWRPIVTTLWPQYLPYQLDKNDEHLCSFTNSMSDVWAAAYYCNTWARVMAADCTQAFINEPQDQWSDVGNRFRSTFLSLGGGCHSAEVFRRFRGRDPSPTALIELLGIGSSE